jgi:2,3-bisphosphoglycerate-dependent phosphoglycerate mutase
MGRLWLPVEKDWRLNERHYGGLTGLDKAETAAKHGDEQVIGLAPQLRHPAAAAGSGQPVRPVAGPPLCRHRHPRTESLKDTIARVLPYWEGRIAPALKAGSAC